jgi:tetratricopeptide (TPR) repeat protein
MTFRYLRHVLAAGFVLVFLSPLAARANTPEQIFVQVSPSVVVVDIFDAKGKSVGQGSGAVIGAGQVITNCHVAQNGKSLQVRQLGKTFKAAIQYADPDRDLCQLSVPDLQAPPVTFGTANKLKVGQRVYAIGAPKGLELTLSEGLISSLRPYEGAQYIQTSAAISPGSSGGGLFDDQGRLVGITTFQIIEGQNLNFALPVDWIGELPKRSQAAPVVAKKGSLDLLNRAIAFEQKQDWRGLLKLSQHWVESEPRSAPAWFYLGWAYRNLTQYDQAVQAYREALRIQPDWASAWFLLGGTYSDLKQYDQAIQAYREGMRIDPEKANVLNIWSSLGRAYFSNKQHDQAIQAYREALRIQPENAETWLFLGWAYNDLKQYDQAIQAYREALRIQPEYALAWQSLGGVYSDLKQYDQAIQAYQEALRIDPKKATVWAYMGFAYAFQGQRDKAREIYQILRKLDPAIAAEYFNIIILP